MTLALDKISKLNLEITSHCNIRCPQCSRTHPMGHLTDWLELKHWNVDTILPNLEIEKLVNLRNVKIEGDNGDAFMHPKLLQILEYIMAAPSRPAIKMLTNGSIRSPRWWRDLGKRYAGRLQVQFSIDGLEDTNPLYRVDVNHERVLNNVRAFVQGGGIATQRCIIFKHNQHQISEITEQAQSLGMKSLIFMANDHTRFQGFEKWAVYDRNFNITHYIENTTMTNLDIHGYNQKEIFPETPQKIGDEICPEWKKGVIAITYLGHIIPCCVYHADLYFDSPANNHFREIVGDTDLIDLHKHKLSSILNSRKFYGQRLTETLTNGKPLVRCQQTCPTVVKGSSFIPIRMVS